MSWSSGDWAEKLLWKSDRIHRRRTENLQDGEELPKPLKRDLKDTVFPFQPGRNAGLQNYSQALPSILIQDKHLDQSTWHFQKQENGTHIDPHDRFMWVETQEAHGGSLLPPTGFKWHSLATPGLAMCLSK